MGPSEVPSMVTTDQTRSVVVQLERIKDLLEVPSEVLLEQ